MKTFSKIKQASHGTVKLILWALFFLGLWEVLLLAQNPGLMSDDSGEMAAAAYRLGLPHPPGYPLFNLIGRLVCLLPIGSVAFRLNLFSEFLSLLSLAFILNTCVRVDYFGKSGHPFRGLFSVILGVVFISLRNVFAQSLTAKGCIYGMTLFFFSGVLWLYVVGQSRRDGSRLLFLGLFLWAVGMANHWQTLVLWVPFGVVWYCQAKPVWKIRDLCFSTTLVLMGLSLYLYLPLRAVQNAMPSWGYPIDFHLFYWVVSRQLVSGVEPWVQDFSFYLKSAKELAVVVFQYGLPGFWALSLAGMVFLWQKNRRLFLGGAALGLPVSLAVFAIHEEQNIYLMPVYLVSLSGLVLLSGFLGMEWIREALPSKRVSILWVAALGLASVAWLGHVFQLENKNRYTLAEDFGTNVLKTLPRGALFLADGDPYVMPLWYERYAKGQRPDLIFEPSVFLFHGWGWKQLADQSEDIKPLVDSSNRFQERLKALSRASAVHPLFYSLGRQYLEPALNQMPGSWIPWGLVWAWEPQRPSRQEMLKQIFRVVTLERQRGLTDFWVSPGLDPSSAQIYRYYAEQFSTFGIK